MVGLKLYVKLYCKLVDDISQKNRMLRYTAKSSFLLHIPYHIHCCIIIGNNLEHISSA